MTPAEAERLRTMRDLVQKIWDWIDALGTGVDAATCDAMVELNVLLYSCQRHPEAVPFEDVDDDGCRFCETEGPTDATLLAPPTNPAVCERPNRTQTIVNIVRAKGPLSKEDLYAEMGRLFELPFSRAKALTSPLLWQLRCRDRVIVTDDEVRMPAPGETNPDRYESVGLIDEVVPEFLPASRAFTEPPALLPDERVGGLVLGEEVALRSVVPGEPAGTREVPTAGAALGHGGVIAEGASRDGVVAHVRSQRGGKRRGGSALRRAPARSSPRGESRSTSAANTTSPPSRTTIPEPWKNATPAAATTDVGRRRADLHRRNAQGLAVGEERLHICAKCSRLGERQEGRFTTPSGRTCPRCRATIFSGIVVVVGVV